MTIEQINKLITDGKFPETTSILELIETHIDKYYKHYNMHFPTVRNESENQLFLFYKAYRANIRAKVNNLRAKSTLNSKVKALTETRNYLLLMKEYLDKLSKISG